MEVALLVSADKVNLKAQASKWRSLGRVCSVVLSVSEACSKYIG